MPFGYCELQANCCAVTLTTSGFGPAWPFFASTIALTIEIAVTSTAGTAVQTISSVVWPWIGGPSDSSSGRDAEIDDRVDEDRGDDREDEDADHRREPVDEVDPAGLAARGDRQPRDRDRDERGDRGRDQRDRDQLNERAPAHPREA